jgi:hypothetical protein
MLPGFTPFGHEVMGEPHLLAVGVADVTDADGFEGLIFLVHSRFSLSCVVYGLNIRPKMVAPNKKREFHHKDETPFAIKSRRALCRAGLLAFGSTGSGQPSHQGVP